MKKKFRAILAATVLSFPAVLLAGNVVAPAAPEPTPAAAPLSAHDRLVHEIAKLDTFLQDQNMPTDKRARLMKARDNMEAQKLKLEKEQSLPTPTPTK